MSNEFFEDENSKSSKKSKTKRPNKTVAFVLVTIALFAGLIYFSIDWALDALIHTRQEVPTPDLHFKTTSEALDILALSNLAMKKAGEEHVENAPAGAVTRQLPAAGTIVREGRVIRVWVSKSEDEISTPNMVGMTLRNAQLLVRQSGLMTGTVENAFSNDYEKGAVMEQKPKAEEPIFKGSVVSLVVSNGPPPVDVILMPEFRLKRLTDLSRWASANDIEVETTEDVNSDYPNGTITEQKPAANAEVKKGSFVEVTVSRRKVEGDEKIYHLHYEMAQGKNSSRVRVTLIDDNGEKDVLNETKAPGSKIDLEIPYGGEGKIRIYINGILVREREVK
ncbi:serine/threonine-protein kinase [Elusimicrobium simillimum]|uniref:PASTA domain-containing protein n=1 Tax=Elusimicrobium simillimum TaxID=3143438 RepID=UPI003C6F4604